MFNIITYTTIGLLTVEATKVAVPARTLQCSYFSLIFYYTLYYSYGSWVQTAWKNMLPLSPDISMQKAKAICYAETFESTYQTVTCHDSEDSNRNLLHHQNLEPHNSCQLLFGKFSYPFE
jgi:hypothetical protein